LLGGYVGIDDKDAVADSGHLFEESAGFVEVVKDAAAEDDVKGSVVLGSRLDQLAILKVIGAYFDAHGIKAGAANSTA
jgi:hypothetical protein